MATGGKNNQEPKIAPTHRGKNWGEKHERQFSGMATVGDILKKILGWAHSHITRQIECSG